MSKIECPYCAHPVTEAQVHQIFDKMEAQLVVQRQMVLAGPFCVPGPVKESFREYIYAPEDEDEPKRTV